MAFTRCRTCKHYDDAHAMDAQARVCLHKTCACVEFDPMGDSPEGTDIYRVDAQDRCWCGHHPESHPSGGRCVVKGGGVPSCTCREFRPVNSLVSAPGYHVTEIEKGELGELSKVREELAELFDAELQGAAVMELCEASDLIGALRAWLTRHHPGRTLDDLIKMADLNERAFRSGRRK